MDLMIAKFQDMRPPKFFGNEGGEKAMAWLKSINYLFNLVEYAPELRLKLAVYPLKDRAQLWWEAIVEAIRESGQIISWEVFRTHFFQEYSPQSYYFAKEAELNQLVQGNMSVGEICLSIFYSSSLCSSRGGRSSVYVRDYCGRCGGRHLPTQCTGVQGGCHTCGLPGHYARVCPNAGYQPSQFSQFLRALVPIPSTPQPSYHQPRGSAQHYFLGPQQARVHALTQDQAHETPGGVIADTEASHSFLSAAFIDEHEIATTLFLDTVSVSTPAVSAMEIFRLLSAENEGFIIYAVDVTQEEMLKVSNILVVKDFPDVFLDEIPGFSPQREIDFSIELILGTNPISRAPYSLALAELKELKEQLRDLLKKGYIRPSYHRSFIGRFSVIARPMTQLTQKIDVFCGLQNMNQVTEL
ncbi:uncharacterized protein LOC142523843 [Primulina tabacum]|uniref:uncharacterized protein LOC142523843 n=1 Tax=Primulina tabacum TaxID=48773 RepID=UPI003F598D1F